MKDLSSRFLRGLLQGHGPSPYSERQLLFLHLFFFYTGAFSHRALRSVYTAFQAKPRDGIGLAAAGLWTECQWEVMIGRDRLTANILITGQARSMVQQHLLWCPRLVMSVALRKCVSDSTCRTAAEPICIHDIVHLMSFLLCMCVFVCACMMDRAQTKSVRGALCQLIQCARCPRWVLQHRLQAPTFPKWQRGSVILCLCPNEQLNLATDEQADVSIIAIWSLIVPFHTQFICCGRINRYDEANCLFAVLYHCP